MAEGNMEKFIIDLGFSDKEAVKGLQNFLKKVEQIKVNVKPKVDAEKKALSKMQDAVSQDALRDVRRKVDLEKKQLTSMNDAMNAKERATLKAKAQAEMEHEQALHMNRVKNAKNLADKNKRRAKADEEHLARVRRFEQSKNFRMLSGGDPDRARNLSKDFTTRSDTLRRQQLGGASPRSMDATARSMNNLKDSVDRASSAMRRQSRVAMGLSTAQRGLADSTRNMVRTYASIFAVFEGVRAINKTGQDFEALNSAMLAAMGTEKEAAKQIAFLDRLTSRLGMSLIDTADQYTKFTFAAKGKLPTEEVNFLFQSMAEMGTVLGVSKERMKLSFTAIQQIKIFKVCLVSNY